MCCPSGRTQCRTFRHHSTLQEMLRQSRGFLSMKTLADVGRQECLPHPHNGFVSMTVRMHASRMHVNNDHRATCHSERSRRISLNFGCMHDSNPRTRPGAELRGPTERLRHASPGSRPPPTAARSACAPGLRQHPHRRRTRSILPRWPDRWACHHTPGVPVDRQHRTGGFGPAPAQAVPIHPGPHRQDRRIRCVSHRRVKAARLLSVDQRGDAVPQKVEYFQPYMHRGQKLIQDAVDRLNGLGKFARSSNRSGRATARAANCRVK